MIFCTFFAHAAECEYGFERNGTTCSKMPDLCPMACPVRGCFVSTVATFWHGIRFAITAACSKMPAF